MKHRILYLFIVMLVMSQPVWAYDFSFTYQGKTLFYSITDISQPRVIVVNSGYDNYVSGDVIIPDSVEYNGTKYAVTSIGNWTFSSCYSLTSVTIPITVTSIGDNAFSGCNSLTSMTIPDSVTSIGIAAFSGCSNLTTMIIGNSVTSISSYTFYYCNSLTSVTIGSSVTSIGYRSFKGCSNLNSLNIPNSVTHIDQEAFYSCSSLTSLTIPNSVTNIGQEAFYGCSGLTSLTIPNSVTHIEYATFYECSGLISLTIPNSVTNIAGSAFLGCTSLTSLTIPNSVTYIDAEAFHFCFNLTSIVVEAGNTRYDSRDSCNAIIQTDLNLLIQGCNSTIIPSTVTKIGDFAFSYCSDLTSVTIPNSVTSIGNHAFECCIGLTSLTIPNSVNIIDNQAFHDCSSLTTVTIGNSVTSIGEGAFYGCSGLISVCCKSNNPPALLYPQYGNWFIGSYPIYVPCGSVSAYQNAENWSGYASRIQGMLDLDYTYVFLSNNDTMGTIHVGTVECDSNITITAIANNGYRFASWSDGDITNPRILKLTGDTMVIAYFESSQGIEDIDGAEIKIYTTEGRIIVQGADGMKTRVYDLTGREMVRSSQNGETPVLPSGVYLVKVGTLPARKVVVMR